MGGAGYRRFNRALLGLCGAGALGLLALAAWLGPASGDLARIGFYPERDFGWQGRQAVFAPSRPGRLDGRYDIVVIGDSFSRPGPGETGDAHYWTDHLAAATGLAVGVFHVQATPLEQVLASAAGRGARLVVLEVVERLLGMVLDQPGDCPTPPAPPPLALPEAAAPARPDWRARPTVGLQGPGQVFGHLRVNAQRLLTGADGTKVRQLRLDPPGPFTSRRPELLLVYRQDFDRRHWDEAAWGRIGCRAAAVQAQVVRGGGAFLMLVAPDKTTAYAAHLAPADRTVPATPRLAAIPGLALVRADLALQAAIAAGVPDVYLPDDTHWGTAGAALVARLVRAAAFAE